MYFYFRHNSEKYMKDSEIVSQLMYDAKTDSRQTEALKTMTVEQLAVVASLVNVAFTDGVDYAYDVEKDLVQRAKKHIDRVVGTICKSNKLTDKPFYFRSAIHIEEFEDNKLTEEEKEAIKHQLSAFVVEFK